MKYLNILDIKFLQIRAKALPAIFSEVTFNLIGIKEQYKHKNMTFTSVVCMKQWKLKWK